MKPIVLCIAAMILLSGCSAVIESGEESGEESTYEIRLCGRELADALKRICQGKYYDPQNEGGVSRKSLRQYPPAFGSVTGWLLSQSTSTSSEIEKYRSRHTRQIVEECCINSCSPAVLMQYCG